jgi:ankyrin repeat protein
LPTIRLLLEHGALVDLPNVQGVTPLMAAAGMGTSSRDRGVNLAGDVEQSAVETLEALLDAGADVNARTAARFDRTAVIARESSMTQCEGHTALYAAVRRGWGKVVDFLVDRDADVDIVDAHGHSPVDAALVYVCGRMQAVVVSEDIAARLRALIDSGR